MRLPEHEHSDIQIGMHFVSSQVSGKPRLTSDSPNYFSLIPSGKPHVGGWGEGSEVVVALLSKGYMERAADELLRSPAFDIPGAPCAYDPVILSLGSVLRREFLRGGVRDLLLLEAVGTVLTGQIVRRWSLRPDSRPTRGRLSAVQLRRTLDAIEEWIPCGISIGALADQLDMGTHRFTRLFRRTMGCGPYRFVMQRRVERARFLLENTSLSLAEISLELGFANQSHFTSSFRRETRSTPQFYRSSFRS